MCDSEATADQLSAQSVSIEMDRWLKNASIGNPRNILVVAKD